MKFVAPTFLDQLTLANGRPAGFDYLRLFLAIEVLVWHTLLMTQGNAAQTEFYDHSVYRALPSLILPMFFALSGFLVAGSLDRAKNIADYIGLRLLRILPALWFVVLAMVLVFGPLLTSYSLHDYFADPRFSGYFLNLICDLHFQLPGVFEHTPDANVVNGQLWTIPLELTCYAMLAVLALVGIYRRPKMLLGFALLVQLAFLLRAVLLPVVWGGIPAHLLYLCFLSGAVLNVYRARIPYCRNLALASALAAYGLIYVPGGAYFIAAPAAYLTLYLGLHNPQRLKIVSTGDYSYGVYLFAYPVQQFVASLGNWTQFWYMNLLLSLPLALMMAFISWHLIEKRALSYRHNISHSYRWPLMLYAKWKQA